MTAASTSARSCCESAEEDEPSPAPEPPVQPSDDAGSEGPSGHSCCGPSDAATSSALQPSRGRGAASGLIKGLKGEFPFDGTQFPRLPWGGKQVSSSDILFIESWIDDGCPATDEQDSARIEVSQPLKMARAQGHEEHPLSTRSVNEFRAESGKIKVRKNIE